MILEGHQLTIGYPDRIVGTGLDVKLQKGEVLALLGPNGGGKTTLLKTLLGLLRPKAGEVRLGGESLSSHSIRQRARQQHELALAAGDHGVGPQRELRDAEAVERRHCDHAIP